MVALTGMEVSNASHYDGATAVAEAVDMAYAQFRGKRTKVVISPAVNPQYRQTLRTYVQNMDVEVVGDEAGRRWRGSSGSPEGLIPLIDAGTALVIVQYPDFFGRIFDLGALINSSWDIDVVYVVTPNALHAEHTIKATRAGKHVLCEKRMEATPEKCQQMIDECKKAGKQLAIGYRLHFDPYHLECVPPRARKKPSAV